MVLTFRAALPNNNKLKPLPMRESPYRSMLHVSKLSIYHCKKSCWWLLKVYLIASQISSHTRFNWAKWSPRTIRILFELCIWYENIWSVGPASTDANRTSKSIPPATLFNQVFSENKARCSRSWKTLRFRLRIWEGQGSSCSGSSLPNTLICTAAYYISNRSLRYTMPQVPETW